MMYSQSNRLMPSMRTVRIFLICALALALLSGFFPYMPLFSMLALALASVALLSIPKMTYPRILLILAAASVGISAIVFLLTRNASLCFAAISFAPATALLTLTVRKRCSRTCGIILASLGMGLFYLACYALAIYLAYNRFSLDLFKELYASMEETFLQYSREYLAYLEEYMSTESLSAQSLIPDEETLLESFKMTLSMLPGLFIDLILGTVWLATVLIRFIFKGYFYGAQRFADWKVTMSKPLALLFLLVAILIFLPIPDSSGILSAVLINALLILTPGFFCIGCSVWKARLFSPGRRIHPLMIVLLVLLALFLSIVYLIYFVALTGVLHLLMPRPRPQKPADPPTDATP